MGQRKNKRVNNQLRDLRNKVDQLQAASPRPQLQQQQQLIHQTTFSTSPIPSAEMLEGYQRVNPAFAEIAVEMLRAEQTQRHHVEREYVSAQVSIPRRAQVGALIVALAGLVAAVLCTVIGHSIGGAIVGGVIGTVDVGAIIALFLKVLNQGGQKELPPE